MLANVQAVDLKRMALQPLLDCFRQAAAHSIAEGSVRSTFSVWSHSVVDMVKGVNVMVVMAETSDFNIRAEIPRMEM